MKHPGRSFWAAVRPQPTSRWRAFYVGVYLLAIVWMGWAVSRYHGAGHGFTSFIGFGDASLLGREPPEVGGQHYYASQGSAGYDAQFYAQIALDPGFENPRLHDSVDNLSYRARRILFAWTAYALGGGEPRLVLNAYALQNVLAWALLALLLLRWFPPNGPGNAVRWLGVLFGAGMMQSVGLALVDGPSLLLLAVGLWAVERGWPWAATAVLALAGLGKETNVLGVGLLAPDRLTAWRRWPGASLRGALVLVPLALWLWWVFRLFGSEGQFGSRNFAPPGQGLMDGWAATWAAVRRDPSWAFPGMMAFCALLALTLQALFLAARPRWSQPAWRLGLSFLLLMLILGEAVWEGFPGAAIRVLLPLAFVFNLLLPRGWRWWPLLLLGNLSVLHAPWYLRSPLLSEFHIRDQAVRHLDPAARFRVRFPTPPWASMEELNHNVWRWAEDDAVILLRNPYPRAVGLDLSGEWLAASPRHMVLELAGQTRWNTPVPFTDRRYPWALRGLTLPPGDTQLRMFSNEPPVFGLDGNPRPLAFRLMNFEVVLHPEPGGRPYEVEAVSGDAYTLRWSDARGTAEESAWPELEFAGSWHGPEYTQDQVSWRWAAGDATLILHNRLSVPTTWRLTGLVEGISPRELRFERAGETVRVLPLERGPVKLDWVIKALPPGTHELGLVASLPGEPAPGNDTRMLSFRLINLRAEVSSDVPAATPDDRDP